ncbi:MAG: hypothetical protein KGJ78_10720 [Alphaproteobacteria bacterium]|nr:hypothetical protein [Alphaproteobacteria bacterium]
MMLVLEVAGGVVLGGIALFALAVWTREALSILGIGVLAVGLLVVTLLEPGALIFFAIVGIGMFLYKQHAERRAQREEEAARIEAQAGGHQYRVARLAELEAAQKIRTLNLGEWSQYRQLKREFDGAAGEAGATYHTAP